MILILNSNVDPESGEAYEKRASLIRRTQEL